MEGEMEIEREMKGGEERGGERDGGRERRKGDRRRMKPLLVRKIVSSIK